MFNDRQPSLNYALITIVIGKQAEALFEITQPFFDSYAKNINADLIVIRDLNYEGKILPMPYYAKLKLTEYLNQYKQVVYLDCDIIILPESPNIFDYVPEENLGVVIEGKDLSHWKSLYLVTAEMGTLENWQKPDQYFNAGMIVCSQIHQQLFEYPDSFFLGQFPDQTFLNWKSRALNYSFTYLDYKFNYLPYYQKSSLLRRESYFVHFAGSGFQTLSAVDYQTFYIYKYYQMKCFSDYLQGKISYYLNPDQFLLINGEINRDSIFYSYNYFDQGYGLIAISTPLILPQGHYTFNFYSRSIDKDHLTPNKPLFHVKLTTQNNLKILDSQDIYTSEKGIISWQIDLPHTDNLEINLYGRGSSFSLDFIEIVLTSTVNADTFVSLATQMWENYSVFPTSDSQWVEALQFLQENASPETAIIAPWQFQESLPHIYAYRDTWLLQNHLSIDWYVLDRSQIDILNPSILESLLDSHPYILLQNDKFYILTHEKTSQPLELTDKEKLKLSHPSLKKKYLSKAHK